MSGKVSRTAGPCSSVRHTWQCLQGSCSLLLQLFAEVIGKKEVVDIALVSQGILVVRTDWSVQMVLDLKGIRPSSDHEGERLTGCWKPVWLAKKGPPSAAAAS